MPPRQSQLQVLLRRRRCQLRRASRCNSAAPDVHRVHATDNESQLLARYGQNNPAIALGRKSWLFAGSDRGGERAAVMYTLIQTARLNDVDPQAWLADVLGRINDHRIQKLDELLPWNWNNDRAILA